MDLSGPFTSTGKKVRQCQSPTKKKPARKRPASSASSRCGNSVKLRRKLTVSASQKPGAMRAARRRP